MFPIPSISMNAYFLPCLSLHLNDHFKLLVYYYSSDLNKNAIVMDDTFGILVDVLKRHKEVVAVQTEVIGAIACLGDVGKKQYC